MTTQAGPGPEWVALGKLFKAQRGRCHPDYRFRARWVRHAEPQGLSERVIRDIENAKRTNFGEGTLSLAERVYGFPPGWVAQALADLRAGHEVRLPDKDDTAPRRQPVRATASPAPARDPEKEHPAISLSGDDIVGRDLGLEPGETLIGWDPPKDGRRHYMYSRAVEGKGTFRLEYDYPEGDPLRQVTERMRERLRPAIDM